MAHTRYTLKPAREVDVAAVTWEHGLAPKKGVLSLVQCPSTGHGATTAGAVLGARARQAPVLRLLPRETPRTGAQARHMRKPAYEVNAAAGTWEHGFQPNNGSLSLGQCPSIGHGATPAIAVRGARAASARAAPLPRRQPAQFRTSALHAQAACAGGRGWHAAARPCTEQGRPLAREVLVHRAWSDHSQRGAARARG